MSALFRAMVCVLIGLFILSPAQAFCGFYVSGADGGLYANATMVTLMREGTTTVLSMQNNYQGPPQDFAMVVPVPVVLQKENVKTLPREIFTHIDSLAAPRLVEYWEQDPCYVPQPVPVMASRAMSAGPGRAKSSEPDDGHGVKIEAQFAVAEYDVLILSAKDSGGLETWLHEQKYNIPVGAAEVLRPYVQSGTRFFVAKVDVARVRFDGDLAVLSPLRFHYTSERFDLPVRLGLLNSQGEQDLIVHVLARGKRYEVANYANATIPTNLRAADSVRDNFASFYEDLFQEARRKSPYTVVTEYAWDSSSCDPCPTPPLSAEEVMSLGADVVAAQNPYGFVLTRLHYRYGRDGLKEDLVFKEAGPITGGTGIPAPDGKLQEGVQVIGYNMFQGRYVMLNPWEGEIRCANPVRGRWGGPLTGEVNRPMPVPNRMNQRGAPVGTPGKTPAGTPAGTSTIPEAGGAAPPENTIPEAGSAGLTSDEDDGCSQGPGAPLIPGALIGLLLLSRRGRLSHRRAR